VNAKLRFKAAHYWRASALHDQMLEEGVPTRRGVMCSHRDVPMADLPLRRSLRVRRPRRITLISALPLDPQMTPAEQEKVSTALRGS